MNICIRLANAWIFALFTLLNIGSGIVAIYYGNQIYSDNAVTSFSKYLNHDMSYIGLVGGVTGGVFALVSAIIGIF